MALRSELDSAWDDLYRWVKTGDDGRYKVLYAHGCNRQVGQLFLMGFDGITVNDQIKSLIEDYHVGSILLTGKNLKCAFDLGCHLCHLPY